LELHETDRDRKDIRETIIDSKFPLCHFCSKGEVKNLWQGFEFSPKTIFARFFQLNWWISAFLGHVSPGRTLADKPWAIGRASRRSSMISAN
jgi:hypothetical protein